MSAIEQAYEMIHDLNEEQIATVITFIHNLKRQEHPASLAERQAAFDELERIRRPIPDFDEKEALENFRREKYGL